MSHDSDPQRRADDAGWLLTAAERDHVPVPYGKQQCLQCGNLISDVAGSKAAVCSNCGFKDPCC